jgi:hypothetical protein
MHNDELRYDRRSNMVFTNKMIALVAASLAFNTMLCAGSWEQLAGNAGDLSKNAVNMPAAQNSVRLTAAGPDVFLYFAPKGYVPRKNNAPYRGGAKTKILMQDLPESWPSKAAFMEDVKNLAHRILIINTQADNSVEAYDKMRAVWERGIPIRYSESGPDFERCLSKPGLLASTGGTDISMCRTLIDNEDLIGAAQVLIHETAHIAGNRNECYATLLELSAMEKAGLPSFSNGYVDECEL